MSVYGPMDEQSGFPGPIVTIQRGEPGSFTSATHRLRIELYMGDKLLQKLLQDVGSDTEKSICAAIERAVREKLADERPWK